jgi:ribonucleoside-diphosphate reductase alpha chain
MLHVGMNGKITDLKMACLYLNLPTWFLDGVLQEFIDRAKGMKFMENTVRSAIKGRAIGIGVLGWHTLLQTKELPFISVASSALRKQISKFIYDEAIKASKAQAIELGESLNGAKEQE